jgi:uncharacterized protein YaaW (UPF0174 family)
MTMRGIQKLAEISTPLLAGGAAGIGAYALTNALTRGAAEAQRQAMTQAIGNYAKTRSAPLIAGAVTALIFGALVASKIRDQAQQPAVSPQRAMFQRQGFYPGEIVPFPAGHTVY